jgi:UDPglucose--hexose-1-phosphate uridylyltransferase
VVIESAAHERSILALDAAAWRDVWELCQRRLGDLAGHGDLAWATLFKNSGPRAGASLEHLHSQLVALDFVPPLVAAELAAAATAADPFGDLVRAARSAGRVVAERAGVVALVPPATRQPFETWILPVDPEPLFHAAAGERVAAVADLTRWFVERLERLVPGADYNWWLHQAPYRPAAAARRWHWHLEIVPRLAPFAGFELGTGCHVTALAPAESARRLRAD